jgi:hypothetical protein
MRIVPLSSLQQFAAVNVSDDPGRKPGPPVAPNCMEVVWAWAQADGKQARNVTHARYTGAFPGTPALALALLNGIQNLFTTHNIPPFWPSGTILGAVLLKDINTPNNPEIANAVGTTLPGTSLSLPVPNESAIVLTLRTAKTGPQNRGRIYLPGWAANAVTNAGVVDPGLVTDLGLFAAGLPGVYTAQGITLCIAQVERLGYTGETGRPHDPRPAATIDVTSVILRDNHFDSQRRRGLK